MKPKDNKQTDLFSNDSETSNEEFTEISNPVSLSNTPLAHKARPKKFEDFKGHDYLFKRHPFLNNKYFPGLIIWGPPGSGKTTLAYLLAGSSDKELYRFSAVLGGVNELKKLIQSAIEMKKFSRKESIIFIDEIHRFNKAQQDALLPYVEEGTFTLIGATTENPRASVNQALLSRVQLIELKKLDEKTIFDILRNVSLTQEIKVQEDILEFIADYSNGDARRALNILDIVKNNSGEKQLSLKEVRSLILENNRDYDKNQNRHYDVISAFIKSLRGSDPNAAILWLAVMLDGGEDPVFIARRLVIFASEDIGNADPQGLPLAIATLHAVQNIGMPEARINLAQAVTYMASTVKSNAAYIAINEGPSITSKDGTTEVPEHLKNHHLDSNKKSYLYPHDFPGHFVVQEYTKKKIPEFYRPTEIGREKNIKERLETIWKKKT